MTSAESELGERLTLADGRRLGYRDLGDAGGRALFFFHGTPGSRLAVPADHGLARLPGVRLLLPERPGYGLSDPQPGRTLLAWAADVAELADHLGIGRFAVGGESGGGPHALACAFALPQRVTVTLALGSPAPAGFRGATRGLSTGNRLALAVGRFAPGVVEWLVRRYAPMFERDPEGFLDAFARQMAPADRERFRDRAFRDAMLRDLKEAYRQGSGAQATDGRLAMSHRGWGFELGGIRGPVQLWHGAEDRLVSRAMAERLARDIPGARLRIVSGAGHLLMDCARVVEELGQVLGPPPPPEPSRTGRWI